VELILTVKVKKKIKHIAIFYPLLLLTGIFFNNPSI